MARFELHVGAAEFWRRARQDIAAARRRLLVQAMTFEGDSAGREVATAIAASPAADRRVLVDDYSRLNISDRALLLPGWRRDGALVEEARATRAMFAELVSSGVAVRRTNPVGLLAWNWPGRNHKKLVVADDVAWIGGMNFSDHNFAWDDLMLRIDGAAQAEWLAADFLATFASRPRAGEGSWPGLRLLSLDGRTNRRGFEPVFAALAQARTSITVISPYLTFPFTDALADAARRGVEVALITPAASNKPTVGAALVGWARRRRVTVWLTPEMIHLKALLIDDERLVVGSSNFDFVSLAAEEELVAIIDDRHLVGECDRRIIAPAKRAGHPLSQAATKANWTAGPALRLAAGYAGLSRLARRRAVEGF